jgi:hypothetical protein
VFLAGWAIAGVGALAIAYGAKSFGGVVFVVGVFITIPFKNARDWRRTWPDDFPVVARLFGYEPQPERWSRTPTWWDTAPAHSRLTRGGLVIVAGVLWFCSAFTPFPLSYGGIPAFAAMLGVCVTGLGVRQVRRALLDLQER